MDFLGSPAANHPIIEHDGQTGTWVEFCTHGIGDVNTQNPMRVAMTTLVEYTRERDIVLPYRETEDMSHLATEEKRQELQVPNFATKTQFQAWWMSELRPTSAKRLWFYHYNESHQRYLARRPGMASTCPENYPLRHMPVIPAYFSKPVCDYLYALMTHWETRHGRKRPDSWQQLKKGRV